jgi:hypothetical protein
MARSRQSAFLTRRIFIIAGLFVTIVGLITCCRIRPDSPPASVTFLGYTNNVSGKRLGAFAVTNLKSFVVRRQAGYWTELRTSSGQTNQVSLWFSSANDLNAQASEIITVPVPTNQLSWRVLLPIRTDLGRVSELVEEFRLMSPYRLPEWKSYELRSDWIDN